MKMGKPDMKIKFSNKGVTLIELLVVLVITGMVVAGFYRIFIAQSKAYVVQDQVAEVQQNVRNAMEILVRDLIMAGCDDETNLITLDNPLPLVADNAITVSYEYFNQTTLATELHTVAYNLVGTNLQRQLSTGGVASPSEIILENVNQFILTYGIDTDNDGYVNSWINAGGVGTSMIIAVRVQLAARPTQVNPDLSSVSPRRLDSIVAMRNQIIKSLKLQ
jgi:prepilin-type N-terminal cleavage/methylation domain-containing protein